MSNLKLGVEVVCAHDLVPQDGQGSVSACVELHFDGQKVRTAIKEKDLNPFWNECFYFNISDFASLSDLALEANVYHVNKTTKLKSFLGKLRLAGISSVPLSHTILMHHQLGKRGISSIFSHVKGELGLKVFLTDGRSVKPSSPPPAIGPSPNDFSATQVRQAPEQGANPNGIPFHENKSEARHTFHSIPKKHHQNHSAVPSEPVRFVAAEMKAESPGVVSMDSSSSSQQSVDYALKETENKSEARHNFHSIPKKHHQNHSAAAPEPVRSVTDAMKAESPNVVSMDSSSSSQQSVDHALKETENKSEARHDRHSIPKEHCKNHSAAPREPVRFVSDDEMKAESPRVASMDSSSSSQQSDDHPLKADECFPSARHSEAVVPIDVPARVSSHIQSKVYHTPRLWYVRVNVIEAQNIVVAEKNRLPNVYCKVQIGNQILNTRMVWAHTMNPLWKEELMFVAAEPFEELLILSVEDHVGPNRDEVIGRVAIHLASIEKRADDRVIGSCWFDLEKPVTVDVDQLSSRLHLCICLDGGYHVLSESTHYLSDLRPTDKQLWKPAIGLLELRILHADGLHPMKTRGGKGTSDTYCVAKYGQKWIRTRTIVDSLNPRFDEKCFWEVYDPATVLTVGVFDNCKLRDKGSNGNEDLRIGKVRIRLSTLETNRVYTHMYPLLVLHPSGVQKMGKLRLAIRFSSTSLINMLYIYSQPLLPKMHHVCPLPDMQLDMLCYHAVNIVAARLGRMEPPLRKEVVEYMSDVGPQSWSMRRSKANFFRLQSVFSGLSAVAKWFGDTCAWKNPISTVSMHALFAMLAFFPELIFPTIFIYIFFIAAYKCWFHTRNIPHMNTPISHAEAVHPDELDEEFDSFPSSRDAVIVRMRYDRLRSVAVRVQTVMGNIATQGERIQALLSWTDPRATAIFGTFSLVAGLVLFITPCSVIVLISVFFIMRHPRFKHGMPSVLVNFFRRLPTGMDSML